LLPQKPVDSQQQYAFPVGPHNDANRVPDIGNWRPHLQNWEM